MIWTILEWLVLLACLVLAWRDGVELFVAWYSGADPAMSLRAGWLLFARAALLVCTAACTGWLLFFRAER